jgi:hypothetical protein
MNQDSLILRRCSEITVKGSQCRNHAVSGGTLCNRHVGPKPTDAGGDNVTNLAQQAFFEVVLKVGMQSAIAGIMELWRTGVLKNFPPFTLKGTTPFSAVDLGAWYSSLDPVSRQRTQTVLALRIENKTA